MRFYIALVFFMLSAAFFLLPALEITGPTIEGIVALPFGLFCSLCVAFVLFVPVVPVITLGNNPRS